MKYVQLVVMSGIILISILWTTPCLFDCGYDINKILKEGYSAKLISALIIVFDLYHSVISGIIVAWRTSRLRFFFVRTDDYCNTFKTDLSDGQRKRLVIVATKLLFLNLMHMLGELLLLTLVVPHKVGKASPPWVVNSTATLAPAVQMNRDVYHVIFVISKIVQAAYSKAVATIIIFMCEYLAILTEKIEMRFDRFVYINSKASRSVEVAKIAFIEMQALIRDADEVFGHTAFDVFFMEILIMVAGLMEVSAGVRRDKLSVDEWHELFNILVSFVTLYLGCK